MMGVWLRAPWRVLSVLVLAGAALPVATLAANHGEAPASARSRLSSERHRVIRARRHRTARAAVLSSFPARVVGLELGLWYQSNITPRD
jgi:hypothetical protein